MSLSRCVAVAEHDGVPERESDGVSVPVLVLVVDAERDLDREREAVREVLCDGAGVGDAVVDRVVELDVREGVHA